MGVARPLVGVTRREREAHRPAPSGTRDSLAREAREVGSSTLLYRS